MNKKKFVSSFHDATEAIEETYEFSSGQIIGGLDDLQLLHLVNEVIIEGCMDESAQNYDPEANIDLWCIYGPSFISIYDVPDDQGGYVFLNWNANTLDVLPETVITHYSVWRYVPNERIPFLKLEKIINSELHIDTVIEKAKKLQNIIDTGQNQKIDENKKRLDNMDK